MPKTLFDKIWEAHEVADGLIYVDLHLVHEVTSPQAFEGLRLEGRTVRRPDKTVATADHNVPTDGTHAARLIADELSRVQVETLERNCEEFGVPIYSLGSERQGIVHVIGPELGVTQPGLTIVCGDSHTSTHGAFGALAIGIGTSEVEHVLATQCLVQRRPKTMRINYSGELGAGVTAKDLILATIGRLGTGGMAGHAVEYAGPAIARALDGGPDDDLQHDDRGRRAGRDDRPRRDDLRVHGGAARRRRRTSTPPSSAGASFPPTTARASTREVEIDAASLSPMVTWGTTPGMVVEVTDASRTPRAASRPADREAAERALAYMALEPGHADAGDPRSTACSSARARTRGSRTCAPRRRWSRPAGRRLDPGDGRPGLAAGQGAGRGGGPATRSSAPPGSSGAARAARCAWG